MSELTPQTSDEQQALTNQVGDFIQMQMKKGDNRYFPLHLPEKRSDTSTISSKIIIYSDMIVEIIRTTNSSKEGLSSYSLLERVIIRLTKKGGKDSIREKCTGSVYCAGSILDDDNNPLSEIPMVEERDDLPLDKTKDHFLRIKDIVTTLQATPSYKPERTTDILHDIALRH